MTRAAALLALAGLSACTLQPPYIRPMPAVPAALPADLVGADRAQLDLTSYRAVFRDPRLLGLLDRALANNQNLRATVANVEAARQLFRVQRAAQLPTLGLSGGVTVRDGSQGNRVGTNTNSAGGTGTGTTAVGGTSGQSTNLSLDLGVSAFELDLFGRLRSLSNAAFAQYLASEAGARSARIALVASVADAWFTYASDATLLQIARDTRATAARSVALTNARLQGGVAPRTDLLQAQTVLSTAEADLANLTAQVRQDRDALDLLVGQPVADIDLPANAEVFDTALAVPPAPLDSAVLLSRPDVEQAEFLLQAANARIGAARAALFPRITLTGLLGFASTALTRLFSGGSFSYSAGPGVSLPIFDGGAGRANLAATRAQREAAVATYQNAIQTAFRDVSDALARRATVGDQVAATQRLTDAARDTQTLVEARYRGGIDTFLQVLDAQRTFYTARRQLTTVRLTRALNGVALYRALGSDPLLNLPATSR